MMFVDKLSKIVAKMDLLWSLSLRWYPPMTRVDSMPLEECSQELFQLARK